MLQLSLYLKNLYLRVGKCCCTYELKKTVLQQIGTMAVYTGRPTSNVSAGEPSPSTSPSAVTVSIETEDEENEENLLFSLH